MNLVDVGSVDDFTEGQISLVTVNGLEVGVASWRGELYAVRNVCPHQSAPICHGVLGGLIDADGVGQVTTQQEAPVIACPWHGWEFSAETGKSLTDPRMHLRRYPVQLRDGRVLLDLGKRGSAK